MTVLAHNNNDSYQSMTWNWAHKFTFTTNRIMLTLNFVKYKTGSAGGQKYERSRECALIYLTKQTFILFSKSNITTSK